MKCNKRLAEGHFTEGVFPHCRKLQKIRHLTDVKLNIFIHDLGTGCQSILVKLPSDTAGGTVWRREDQESLKKKMSELEDWSNLKKV